MPRYHMQRAEREITDSAAMDAILAQGKFCTLALARGDEPYVVTLSYGYDPEARALYFHCANAGLKLAFLRENPRVCGTVVQDRGYKVGECAHAYSSVVFWGTVEILHREADKREALGYMIDILEPDPEPVRRRFLKEGGTLEGVTVLKLSLDEMTGKSAH